MDAATEQNQNKHQAKNKKRQLRKNSNERKK